jgi:Transcriptional regulator
VAIEFFSERGFNGVSIRDITREVGIKESSFYKHYKSKDELLDTIFGYFNSELAKAKVPEHIDNEPVLKTINPLIYLNRAFEIFKSYADTSVMAKIYRIAVTEQFRDARARDILIDLYEKSLPLLERYFNLILQQKKATHLNPKILANCYQFALHAMVAEFSLLKQYRQDTAIIEQRIAELNAFFGELIKNF